MRKTFQLLFVLFLVFAWCTTFAQDMQTSNGPIPKMKLDRAHEIVNPSQNRSTLAFGHSSIQLSTLSMPIPAGTPFTLLSPWTPPVFASSMVKTPGGQYYITEVGPPAQLFQLDPGTGAVTLVGNITGMGADQPNGIKYNPANSTYYIVSSANLYSFNLGSLTATLIGPFNTGGLMIDLCFTTAGVCYAYDLGVDNAYTVNISTGAVTLLGPLGYDANFGQGMSYDNETSTIYLSAFNNATFTGQLRTMDPGTGMTTLITDWGFDQVAPFHCDTQFGPPCPIGGPSNPNPPNGTTGLGLGSINLGWTNGVGTVNVEVWFGPQGSVTKIYDGPAVTSYPTGALQYFTTYYWWIVCKDATCGTQGPSWNFQTMQDPNIIIYEPFNDLSCWTPIGPLGLTNWSTSNTTNAGGTAPELMLSWTPSFVGETKLLSCVYNTSNPGVQHSLSLLHMCDWYADPAPSMGLGITYDGGATFTTIWTFTPVGGNVGPEVVNANYTPTASSFQFVLFMNGDSFNIDFWYVDNIVGPAIPVELKSFTAKATDGVVELSWITATETNNSGFEVERNNGSEFETIAFVEGHGTTTELQAYSYTDRNVNTGSYSYRLKQIDFDGTFEYSDVVEIDVPAPSVFSLEQNYPNPFNPSTMIGFNLAVDSKVSLKVFDVLGQEVASILNSNLVAGSHQVDFDASSLNTGVYLYRLEATGIDGTNFVDVKKMILTK